ncbi:MAG: DNA replication/repair protein RecF [Luteolibacter sp.]
MKMIESENSRKITISPRTPIDRFSHANSSVKKIRVIRSLRLMDFRCFESLDLEAPEAGAILTGDNAQGKTSILEAICMLVRLQSPRSHRLATLARFGKDAFGIAGYAWEKEHQVKWTRSGISLKQDTAPCNSRSDYLAQGGLVVWMGNEDLELIRGPGETRRRYLDFIGSQIDPAYRRAWSRYRRALTAKNLLLREGQGRDKEIFSYDQILAEHGTYLIQARAQMIAQLNPFAANAQSSISGRNESLTLDYLPASGPDLHQSIIEARERERKNRQSVVGPHRDDVSLRIDGKPAADFASEGQQRTIALALKLAQGRLLESAGKSTPVYLLDDIFGELDPQRRNALINHMPSNAQKWITTTHLDWLKSTHSLGAMLHFTIKAGTCLAHNA